MCHYPCQGFAIWRPSLPLRNGVIIPSVDNLIALKVMWNSLNEALILHKAPQREK